VTDPTPFFTNLVDSEDTAGEVMGAGSSEGTEDDVHLLFRHITDMRKVCFIWMNSFSCDVFAGIFYDLNKRLLVSFICVIPHDHLLLRLVTNHQYSVRQWNRKLR